MCGSAYEGVAKGRNGNLVNVAKRKVRLSMIIDVAARSLVESGRRVEPQPHFSLVALKRRLLQSFFLSRACECECEGDSDCSMRRADLSVGINQNLSFPYNFRYSCFNISMRR